MSQSTTPCGGPSCMMITADNACDTFPDLPVTPTPEPDPRDEEAHAEWRAGYQYWSQVRCPCGNGYFCRRHARWIPGSEVTSGMACPREEEGNNFCPPSHYAQPSEERRGAPTTRAWPADQAVLQHDDYSHDAPGTPSSPNRRSSTTREVGQSSNRRSHRRRRSDREPTSVGRGSRQAEYDNPVDYAGSYTQQEDQQQSPDPVIGSGTSWTSSPYSTTSTYPASSSYQAWYSSGQASSYNQSYSNDEPVEAATPSTYNADYDTHGLSDRMGSMTIRGDSYLQEDADGSSRYLQQQEEDENVPEDPVEPPSQSQGQRRKKHKRRSSRR